MVTKFKSILAAGLVGLLSVASTRAEPKVGITYFPSEESKSSSQNQYVELDYATQLPGSIKLSGAVDFYDDDSGYFGKTALDRSLDKGLGLRVQEVHGNELLTQTGAGLTYVLPTPKNTFGVVRYLPLWLDKEGNQVDNKQILGYYASVDLPKELTLSSFGEVNLSGKNGPQWAYGEVEVAKKLTDRLSVGANLQLNGQGAGKMNPEVVPRLAIRAKF